MARILFHSCAPWACSGYGVETAIWTQELQRLGHEVIISTYWGIQGGATMWNGMTILPGYGPNYCSTSLYQHAKAYNPDLIITLGDVWVMNADLLRELPVAHWLPSDCRPMSLADRGVVDSSGAQLIAMSEFGLERFKRAGFDPVYVPHAIDTDVFRPLPNRGELREAAGLPEGMFVVGVNQANNDAIRKALPEQMLAFAKFAEQHPGEVMLTLHTGVHQEGGQDLEAVAENLGIVDLIRIVDQYRYTAGMISQPDLNEWYNVIDVLSQTVYAEGFGLPVMEAQAAGTPVITTDASSMTEINPHGIRVGGQPFWNGVHKGWWVSPSVSEIADAYERAFQERGNVDSGKLRRFAREYSIDRVSVEFMQPAVETLIKRVAHKVSRPSEG